MKNIVLEPKKKLAWNWVKSEEGKKVRLVKESIVIPEGPSNSLYTFCNICILAIKKAKELKGSVDREVDYLNPMSPEALKLIKIADILGYQMIKLANLGYKISRKLEEYKTKTVDEFINIYSEDKRETWEYKRKGVERIRKEYEALQDLIVTQGNFYTSSEPVQMKVLEELEDIYEEMSKGYILLQTIKTNVVQSNAKRSI